MSFKFKMKFQMPHSVQTLPIQQPSSESTKIWKVNLSLTFLDHKTSRFDIKNRNPTFKEQPNRKVIHGSKNKRGIKKIRSSQQIKITKLKTRPRQRSENIDPMDAQKLVNEVEQQKANHTSYSKMTSERMIHSSIPASTPLDQLEIMANKITNDKSILKSHHSVDSSSVSKTDIKMKDPNTPKKTRIETTDVNNTAKSIKASVPLNMSEGASSFKTKDIEDDSFNKNSPNNDSQDLPTESRGILAKRDSLAIPLNTTKEDNELTKRLDNNEELGIIQEEQSQTCSSVVNFNNRREHRLSPKPSISYGYEKTMTKQNSIIRPGFLSTLITCSANENSNNKASSPVANPNDEVMSDLYLNLNKLSTSNADLKEISEEFSKASESEFFYKGEQNSSYSSHKKHMIKRQTEGGDQHFSVSAFKKDNNESGLQSISSIFGNSSININPEEKGNEGVIISRLINSRKQGKIL